MSSRSGSRPPVGWFSARRTAVAIAAALPVSWRLRVRRAYLNAGPGRGRRWRRAVLDVVRLGGIPRTDPFPVPGRPDVRMVPSDSYIANHLFWLGLDSYEPGGPEWWASLVATHHSTLELGANVGLYSVIGALEAPDRPYTAVEANPASADVLRENLRVNGLHDVDVVQAAVVAPDSPSQVSLRFPDRDPYGASAGAFVTGAPDRSVDAHREITIPAVAITTLTRDVDLVKLDIEGLEVAVLDAVRPWLVASMPSLLVELRDDASELRTFLARLVDEAGFACVVIADGRPLHIRPEAAMSGAIESRYGTRDLTLIAPERLGPLLARRIGEHDLRA